MVSQPYRFSLAFSHRYDNLPILEFSSKWVKVILPYREGVGLPVGQITFKIKTLSLTLFFLDSQQIFRKVCKKLDFSPKK
jgi:hypothetical protein